jgi:polyhydroxybutyrate depolymerase
VKRWLVRVTLALLVLGAAGLACLRGDPAPDWGPSAKALQSGELSHGGLVRHYLWYQPQGEGPFVVFPDGFQHSWNDARHEGPAADKGLDDTAFLVALADELIAHHRADPKRVYAIGLSNGAMMALTLACRAADRFAGVVAVAGQWPTREACHPAAPLSVGLVLGDADPLVPYQGGQVAKDRGDVLSGLETASLFAHLDGCGAEPRVTPLPDTQPNDGTTTSLDTFSGCREGAEVRLYTVHGGGHTWPGGWQYLAPRLVGKTSRDWSASEEMWAFLKDKHR